MAVSLKNAESALKSLYLDVATEQINTGTNPFLNMITKTSNDVWGKDIKKLVVNGVNGGFGSGTEDGDLPVSSGLNYETLTLPLKNFYGTIEISDKAMRASANHAGAFVNLLNAEMESLIKSCKMNFSRMLFGDGSGKLATVVDYDSKEYVQVDSVRNLMEGMVVDFVYTTGDHIATIVKGRRIVGVNRDTDIIKISEDLTNCIHDVGEVYITVQNSLNNELTGLEAIFSRNGELYGLNKKDNDFLIPYWDCLDGPITEAALQKALDEIEKRSGYTINIILCSFDVKRAIQRMLKLDGVAGSVSYEGIPVVADRFCPEGTLYLLNTNDFELYQLCDWQWLEGSDGTILHQVPGKPVYSATLVKYANLLCSKPCGQGKISGIREE